MVLISIFASVSSPFFAFAFAFAFALAFAFAFAFSFAFAFFLSLLTLFLETILLYVPFLVAVIAFFLVPPFDSCLVVAL